MTIEYILERMAALRDQGVNLHDREATVEAAYAANYAGLIMALTAFDEEEYEALVDETNSKVPGDPFEGLN